MHRTHLVHQFAAAGWSATAAGELADIHLRLQAERAAATRIAERTALLGDAPTVTQGSGGHQPRRLPLLRLLALIVVSTLLVLSTTACGGGGSEDDLADARPPHDLRTPRVDCSTDPSRCG